MRRLSSIAAIAVLGFYLVLVLNPSWQSTKDIMSRTALVVQKVAPEVEHKGKDTSDPLSLFGLFDFSAGIRAAASKEEPDPDPLQLRILDHVTPGFNTSSPYFLVDLGEPITYEKANEYCIDTVGGNGAVGQGSRLASVEKDRTIGNRTLDQGEQINELKGLCTVAGSGSCWIGLQWNDGADLWIWESGSVLSPSPAPPGQTVSLTDWIGGGGTPDPSGTNKLCVILQEDNSFQWQNVDCCSPQQEATVQSFICENPHYYFTASTKNPTRAPTSRPSRAPSPPTIGPTVDPDTLLANSSSLYVTVEFGYPVSYETARNYCVEALGKNGAVGSGSTLATVEKDRGGPTQEQQIDQMKMLCRLYATTSCWIGLRWSTGAGEWIWDSGSVYDETDGSVGDWVGSTPNPPTPPDYCVVLEECEHHEWQNVECSNPTLGDGSTVNAFLCTNPFYTGYTGTKNPTRSPTVSPTPAPTQNPTPAPTQDPTPAPTQNPTQTAPTGSCIYTTGSSGESTCDEDTTEFDCNNIFASSSRWTQGASCPIPKFMDCPATGALKVAEAYLCKLNRLKTPCQCRPTSSPTPAPVIACNNSETDKFVYRKPGTTRNIERRCRWLTYDNWQYFTGPNTQFCTDRDRSPDVPRGTRIWQTCPIQCPDQSGC